MEISLRRAKPGDYQKVIEVESKSTPNLRYLGKVYKQWVSDEQGEFIVAEIGDELVGCGKFTVMPDGSAWVEALRIPPEHQGKGAGSIEGLG